MQEAGEQEYLYDLKYNGVIMNKCKQCILCDENCTEVLGKVCRNHDQFIAKACYNCRDRAVCCNYDECLHNWNDPEYLNWRPIKFDGVIMSSCDLCSLKDLCILGDEGCMAVLGKVCVNYDQFVSKSCSTCEYYNSPCDCGKCAGADSPPAYNLWRPIKVDPDTTPPVGENTIEKSCDNCRLRDTVCNHIKCITENHLFWEPTSESTSESHVDNLSTQEGVEYVYKSDAGLVDMSLLEYFPNALSAVCKQSMLGCTKYERGSFKDVPNARMRYTAAMFRHFFKEGVEDEPNIDDESGLGHDVAVAWNALVRLELRLRGYSRK